MTLDGKTYSVVNRSDIFVNLLGARGAKYALIKNLRHGYWTLLGKGGREMGQFTATEIQG